MHVYKTLDTGIKIVEYNNNLAQALADMWNQSRESWGGDSDVRTASQMIAEHAGASHFNVYLAMDGEEVVGYCSFGRYSSDVNTLYIPLLNVRPDYHSKKIGKALVLQCVERTIELGYPRLDLYTWAGNTAAVPLYKKCGFLWEDRPDRNHFVNFIPIILKTDLFTDFFKKADWYEDAVRDYAIKPDGVKTNKFETFGYTWKKGEEMLSIGFERSGRIMRMIETNDYKIELMAENHELAFGLDYNCAFKIENKSGKDLHIKITGQEDANIKFVYNFNGKITEKQELTATFHVGAINEPQDPWKIYPCLTAIVEINGQSVVFGMGIESKFPVVVNLSEECDVKQKDMEIDCFIDIESALAQDAKLSFDFPQNDLISFAQKSFSTDLKANSKTSIAAKATILGMGYEAVPIQYKVLLQNGKELTFTKPLSLPL